MDRKPLIIKKYENRRLYDTTNSRYINLDEVAQMVRDGRDLRVVDAASGEDLTRLILTQIMMDDAREPNSVFPLDMLRQMIVASGKASQESALKYMKTMMDMYQNAYRFMGPVSQLEFMPGPWGHRPSGTNGSPSASPAENSPGLGISGTQFANPGQSGNRSEVDELKRRVAELETLITRHTSRKKSPGKPKKNSRRKA